MSTPTTAGSRAGWLTARASQYLPNYLGWRRCLERFASSLALPLVLDLAITNQEGVGKSLALLKAGLGLFVERELKGRYGAAWAGEAKEVLSDTRLGASKEESLQDIAALLVIMDRKWGEVFR